MKIKNKVGEDITLHRPGNHFSTASATDFVFDNNEFRNGLQSILSRPQKVRRAVRCIACGKHRNPVAMSAIAGVCRSCVANLREKTPTARNNFIEKTKANVGR